MDNPLNITTTGFSEQQRTQKETSVTTHTSYVLMDKTKFHHPTNDAILKCNCMKLFFTLHRMLLSTWKTWKKETLVVDKLFLCYGLKIYYWTFAH